MNFEAILIPAAVMGSLGITFGLILSFAAKAFEVKVDERIGKARDLLPGVNCGACGESGCDSFAEALVEGRAKIDGCPVGGESTAQDLADLMGVELTGTAAYTARVFCGGTASLSRSKYEYSGLEDCAAAAALHGGHLACGYGCLGFGNCAKACPFDAILMIDGLARIVEEKCKSCEKCVAACPKKLIQMVPRGQNFSVACMSKDKGPVTKKNCSVGCIGCTKCVKVCPRGAITMNGPLARIDPLLCHNCGDCLPICPTGAIEKLLPNGRFKRATP